MNPSPLKGRPVHRPKYKAMWQDVCVETARLEREAKQATNDFYAQVEDTRRANFTLSLVRADLLAENTQKHRWATAAVIEALALIVVAILLFAR